MIHNWFVESNTIHIHVPEQTAIALFERGQLLLRDNIDEAIARGKVDGLTRSVDRAT